MTTPRVAVLPGEGVGPEVMEAALHVLAGVLECDVREGGPIGRAAWQAHGAALTEPVAALCAETFAAGGAVLCGPGGQRFVYDLRARFDLYIKRTPVRPIAALADAGPLRPEAVRDVDLLVVRENAGGLYFGPSEESDGASRQSFRYRDDEVRRLLAEAVRQARARRGRLALAVKPGAMPAASAQWTRIFEEMGEGVQTEVLEVDNAAYQIVARARSFDVVAAPNLFGDILSDLAALLLGSRGLSYSGNFDGNFHGGGAAVFQTGHGCAHDLAGRDVANPLGQILSAAMMLRAAFDRPTDAARIERAVERTVADGFRTADIAGPDATVVGTREMGRRVAENL
ncbi:MAG: isocitrate/isopropylmalate family dehydrogenase [Planctomycetota bacterium]